jgi:hypothetical protein
VQIFLKNPFAYSIISPLFSIFYFFLFAQDTFFIIMDQKWEQLTFLHVYHHATIFSFYWLNLRVCYDGDIFLTITLNGFVHAIMYAYYFLCLHKPPDIWWKPYLTIMQMVQFLIMVAQVLDNLPPPFSPIFFLLLRIFFSFLYLVHLFIFFVFLNRQPIFSSPSARRSRLE